MGNPIDLDTLQDLHASALALGYRQAEPYGATLAKATDRAGRLLESVETPRRITYSRVIPIGRTQKVRLIMIGERTDSASKAIEKSFDYTLRFPKGTHAVGSRDTKTAIVRNEYTGETKQVSKTGTFQRSKERKARNGDRTRLAIETFHNLVHSLRVALNAQSALVASWRVCKTSAQWQSIKLSLENLAEVIGRPLIVACEPTNSAEALDKVGTIFIFYSYFGRKAKKYARADVHATCLKWGLPNPFHVPSRSETWDAILWEGMTR